eukprot:4019136-Amphidinium_carterae.1
MSYNGQNAGHSQDRYRSHPDRQHAATPGAPLVNAQSSSGIPTLFFAKTCNYCVSRCGLCSHSTICNRIEALQRPQGSESKQQVPCFADIKALKCL